MAKDLAPKTDDEIISIVQGQLEQSVGYDGKGELTGDRIRALRYYRGEKFGNEIEGRSQIVSRDVAEVIDGLLPDLLKPFVSGDEAVKFEPRGPEDEKVAAQATEYANYIWNVDNPGFMVFHDWLKDGLLSRLGVVKIWWEKEEETSREEYGGLTQAEVSVLESDPSVVSIEIEEEGAAPPQAPPGGGAQPGLPGPGGGVENASPGIPPAPPPPDMADPMAMQPMEPPPPEPLFNAVVQRVTRTGKVKVRNLPPEEFLVGNEGSDQYGKPFVAHRCKRSLSDLRQMGVPEDVIDMLPTGGGSDLDIDQERRERERPEDEQIGSIDPIDDPAQHEVTVTECYLKLDADGDGIAEYRQVILVGDPGSVMIANKEVDDHPFAWWTPYPVPHKVHGESAADKVMDVQLTKSAILRQMLDNLYLINNSRTEIVEGQVNLDDFLSSKPGGYVRVKKEGMMREIVVPPVFQNAFPALEYLDTVRENRSGATRYNQGMDADSLNKTATGIQAIMGKAAGRQELIARVFAETGVRRAFRIILRLINRYQDKARTIRLRNEWVDIDPRSWNSEMDVSVAVGLGTGNKDQQLNHLAALWEKQLQGMQAQGGPDGPLVTMQNLYATGAKFATNAGLKNPEEFWSDPSKAPPQPPKPDPAMVKAEAEIEANKAKQEADFALKDRELQHDMTLKERELQIKAASGFYQPQPQQAPPRG